MSKVKTMNRQLLTLLLLSALAYSCASPIPISKLSANDNEGKAVVGKVNVDHNSAVSQRFGIRNIPTILFLKNGEVVDKSVGAVPKNVLAEKLDALL